MKVEPVCGSSKSTEKQIGEQNMSDKLTENAVIAVLKAAIKVRMPALYRARQGFGKTLSTDCEARDY